MEEQGFILIQIKNKMSPCKKDVVAIFTDVTDFDNKHTFTSAS